MPFEFFTSLTAVLTVLDIGHHSRPLATDHNTSPPDNNSPTSTKQPCAVYLSRTDVPGHSTCVNTSGPNVVQRVVAAEGELSLSLVDRRQPCRRHIHCLPAVSNGLCCRSATRVHGSTARRSYECSRSH